MFSLKEINSYIVKYRNVLIYFIITTEIVYCQSSFPNTNSCYEDNSVKYHYYSTYTDYLNAAARVQSNINYNQFQVPFECNVSAVWQYGREGTIHPTSDNLTTEVLDNLYIMKLKIINNHKEKRGELCEKDIENFKMWQGFREDVIKEAGELSSRGSYVLLTAAQEYSNAFLKDDDDFTPQNFEFYYGSNAGAKSSAESLFLGWTPRKFIDIQPDSYLHEWVSYSSQCPSKNNEVDSDYSSTRQRLMNQVLKSVATRLGFAFLVTEDEVWNMYDACRISSSLQPTQTSTWCAAFSTLDLKILEYLLDCYYYRQSGYGLLHQNRPSFRSTCSAVRNLLNYFTNVTDDDNNLKGRFIVTDLESVLKLITIMDAKRDALPIIPSNIDLLATRRWRTSLIVPMGGHVMLSLVKCGTNNPEYYVRAYIQGVIEKLLNCTEICPWDAFQRKLKDIEKWCSMDPCSSNSIKLLINPSFLLVLLILVYDSCVH